MKSKIREIITTWWQTPLPTIYPRNLDLINYFNPHLRKVLLVTGFRRVGKTFTLLDFAQKYGQSNCIYLNFEDDRLPQTIATLTKLSEVIRELRGTTPTVLLLDEIQEIAGWSRWVRRMNETTPHHLIISGSSSRLISSELPTELRGQTITLPLSPLTWSEYCCFHSLNLDILPSPDVESALRNYLTYGGLPEIVLAEPGLRPHILASYYSSFVEHDLIDRHHIRKNEALADLLRLLPTTHTFTYSKLAHSLASLGHSTTKDTVMRYLTWIQEAYFFSQLALYSASIKKRLQSPKKGYLIDNYFSSYYGNLDSPNLGHLMEQVVYHHLLNLRDTSLHYWKDFANHEVDFVVTKNNQATELIQVSYIHDSVNMPDREIKSLIKASGRFPHANLILITWDVANTIKKGTKQIKLIPLSKFLTSIL